MGKKINDNMNTNQDETNLKNDLEQLDENASVNLDPELENNLGEENKDNIENIKGIDENIDFQNNEIESDDELDKTSKQSLEDELNDSNSKKSNKKKIKQENSDIKLSEDIVNEKMKQALETQNPNKRKKSIIWSLILLLFNIVFMIFIIKNLVADVEDFSFKSLIANQGGKLWWFLVGIIIYLLFIFVQIIFYRILIKNLAGKKSWKTAYDVAVIGKYYDNVTPFAVGGQPMQIIALAKDGISPAVSTGIPLIKMVVNTGISALLSLVFFIFGLPLISATTSLNQILIVLIEILGIIGLIFNILAAIFMFLISSGTLFTRSFIRGIVRFIYKIKIVKNYRQTYRKTLNQVAEYKYTMKYLWNNKKILFSLLGLNLLEVLCLSSFSFIVVMALSQNLTASLIFTLFISMTKFNLCQMASSYIPLPGGTGLMEISFIILFGMSLGENIVWGLLGWRFLSYYIILVHGFVHELIKIIKNLIDGRKIKIATQAVANKLNGNLAYDPPNNSSITSESNSDDKILEEELKIKTETQSNDDNFKQDEPNNNDKK